MDMLDIQDIPLDTTTRKKCKLTIDKFYIKKENNPFSPGKDDNPYFFASTNRQFEKTGNPACEELFKDDLHCDYYKNQLGYIECKEGYISYVYVTWDEDTIDARGCGISTILTTLCMIDPTLNLLPESKIKEQFIHKYSNDPTIANSVRKGCKRFIGLTMAADPLTGAYAYFNAALDNNKIKYNKMLFKNNLGKYKWIKTEKAKECYDEKTGKIGDTEGKRKQWWFCEEIKGKLPKLPDIKGCTII